MHVLKCILILTLWTFPFLYSFLHPQTYPPHNVVNKVISLISHPYALTNCRLPLLCTRLDQMLKHMTRSVLWCPQRRRPQGQTIDSILDLSQCHVKMYSHYVK